MQRGMHFVDFLVFHAFSVIAKKLLATQTLQELH